MEAFLQLTHLSDETKLQALVDWACGKQADASMEASTSCSEGYCESSALRLLKHVDCRGFADSFIEKISSQENSIFRTNSNCQYVLRLLGEDE